MKVNEYKRFVTKDHKFSEPAVLFLGLAGETGEVVDVYKKYLRDGKLDQEHMLEELGDVLWYLFNIFTLLNISLEEVMDYNVKKLNKRYGTELK